MKMREGTRYQPVRKPQRRDRGQDARATDARGFTILETTFALALLVITFASAWLVLDSANRSQRILWDDLAANEMAVSALEQALSQETCGLTPPEGRVVDFSTANKPQALPESKVTLHVTPAADQAGMREIRATVTWREVTGRMRSIELTMRRREK